MRPIVSPVLMIIAALAACSGSAPVPQETGSPTPAAKPHAASSTRPATPPTPAAKAVTVSESSDLYAFDYSYPAPAAAIPALKAWLDKDLAKQKAQLVTDAREGRKAASDDGFPYNPYDASTGWSVVTDLPGWLSLSAAVGSYSGGAHPNHWFGAILWDKTANIRREATDLFTSKAALKAAVSKPFCAALDKQRSDRRGGEDWSKDGIDDFTQCIDPLKQVVILGSRSHKGFDRIGFLIAPYNAGPYAEGDYEVTVPITPQVLAAVKPEFRGAFVAP